MPSNDLPSPPAPSPLQGSACLRTAPGGGYSSSRAAGKRPAAILNRLPPPRAPTGTGSPRSPGRREGRWAQGPAPRPPQPPLLTTSPLLSSLPPPRAAVPAPASPTAPRLREGAWLTVKSSPASPRPPSYCRSPQRNSLPPSAPVLPARPRLQMSGRLLLAVAKPGRRRSPLRLAAPLPWRSASPAPPGTAHGRLRGCHGARALPSAARGWREAEPRFQTAAKAPRRVWALSHGLRREQVQTWPRCSPRGAARRSRGGTATPRPRRLPRWALSPSAVGRFPQGQGGPGANRCRPPRPLQPLPLPGAAAPPGVPGLMTPLARLVAFPVWAWPAGQAAQPEDGEAASLSGAGGGKGRSFAPLRKPLEAPAAPLSAKKK